MTTKYSDQQDNDFNNAIQLDSEFDQHLASMKKYILLLSDKQAKQNCALWIKKLCEISDSSNLNTKQIRNSHSFSLLRNLQTSQYLSYPFNDKPPNGELRYLHSPDGYHDRYTPTKSNSSQHSSTQNSSQAQDIKRLNLESGTSSSSSNDSANFNANINDRKSIFDERDYNSSYSESIDNADYKEDRNDQTTSQKMMSFLNNNNNNNNNYINNNNNNNNKTNANKFTNSNIKNNNNLNTTYRRREKSMPNILNQNMSAPRTEQVFSQQNTRNEYQMTDNSDLQAFVMNLNQQSEQQRISLEKQKNFQIHQLEFQIKRLESKFQEDKMDLQHQHNLEIQKIMDRKNHELEKVKKEHRSKVKDNEDLISNLERKVNSLAKQVAATQMDSDKRLNEITTETQRILDMHQAESDKKFKDLFYKSEKEKADLQKQHTQAFQVLVEETNARLRKVEAEYNDQQSITDNVVKELEARTELLKKEMEKNLGMIDGLENEKKEMRSEYEKLEKELAESKKKSQASMGKLKETHAQEIGNLKGKMEAKIQEIRFECQKTVEKELKLMDEIEKNKALLEKKNQKMVNLLREKDYHIENLKENIKKQEIQAENALNEIRDQVEQNSKRIYDEMEEQMNKCESDLAQSKSIAEKHAKESHKELEKLKSKHEKEIHKLKNEFAMREQSLKQELDEERKNIMRHNNESLAAIQDKNIEHNFKYQSRIESLTNTICQQDLQIAELQREVAETNSLRKNQIIELGILREDEKTKLIKEKDLEIEDLKMEAEVNKKSIREEVNKLKEAQKEEIKTILFNCNQEKTNMTDHISHLEDCIKNLKYENQRILQINDQNIKEAFNRLESEKCIIKRPLQSRIKKLEKEIEFVKKTKENVEFQLNMVNSEFENSMTKLKMNYEEKQKGLLPYELKQEYEETIASLKSQVQILQQRTHFLQSELEDRNHLVNSSSCTASM